MDPKYVDNKKQTQCIRRPFGVAGKLQFQISSILLVFIMLFDVTHA